MSRVIMIPPGASLQEEVLCHLENTGSNPSHTADPVDYSSNMVVFPGRRPSHFLRKTIADTKSGSFIPPAIFSMDDFVDFVYEDILAIRRRKIEKLDSVAILHDIHKGTGDPLGGSSFMSPEVFLPLGIKIANDIEDLQIEGIETTSLREMELLTADQAQEAGYAGGETQETDKRLQSISSFYDLFYSKLNELQLSTRSVRYRAVAERRGELSLKKYGRVIIAGFFALTGSEKLLFKRLLEMDKAVFIFQDADGITASLKELGIKPELKEVTGDRPSLPEVSFYRSPDTHGQVFGAGGILQDKLESGETLSEDTVIVLPASGTLFPLIQHLTPVMEEDNYNISMGYPLYRTPLYTFFNNLMDLISSMEGDRLYMPDYLRFVLHPYTKNIYFKTPVTDQDRTAKGHGQASSVLSTRDVTRIIFHTIEESLAGKSAKPLFRLSELEDDKELLKTISDRLSADGINIGIEGISSHLKTIHRNTIGKLLATANTGDFSLKVIEILMYIYGRGTARLHMLFQPFAEAFLDAMGSLSDSLFRDIRFDNPSGYFNFFRKYIMTCSVPFEGTPLRGVQVLGLLETRNIRFKKVFILDLNEGKVPDTRRENSILPLSAREKLGLPTYREREKLTSYYFKLLLRGAKEVHLFYQENNREEKSRFAEELIWERQKADRSLGTAFIDSVQYSIKLKKSDPSIVRKTEAMTTILSNHEYSATALDDYLRCPLKFYYRHLLKLYRKETFTAELDKSWTGNFVHDILADYFSARKGRVLSEDDLDWREMEILLDTAFSKYYGDDIAGTSYLLKERIKERMKDLLDSYYIPLTADEQITVLDVEKDIRTSWEGFKLRGRIDKVEKRGKKICIVDYKTGGNAEYLKIDYRKLTRNRRETWADSIGSLQLPFYLMLYMSLSKGVPPPGCAADAFSPWRPGGLYLLLGRKSISRDIELHFNIEEEGADERYSLIEGIIKSLLDEVTDPELPFTAAENKEVSCPFCDFRFICGTEWVQN